MATGVSGSVSFYSAGNTLRVYYVQTFTPGVAKSTVTISKVTLQSDVSLGGSFFFDGKIIVNGEVVYSRSIAGSDGGVTVNTSENVINLCYGESVTVYHSAATTISIQLAANTQGVPCFYQYGYGDLSIPAGSRSVTLDAIPMASAISAVAVPLGSEMTVSLVKAASGMTDTITWQCGTQSGTIASNSAASSFTWTPPVSLASQAPDSTSVSITLTTATKNGSTSAGSSSVTVSCPIPAGVKPTVSLAVSDEMGYLATFGSYIRSQSKARVITTAAGVYGSAITGISVTCGTLTGSGENLLFALANAGTVTVSVTVTDSRGRTAAAEVQIYVADYSPPAPEITALYRCNADGTAAADGAWAKAEFDCAFSSLGGKNTAACVLKYRVRGTSNWTEKAVTAPGSTVFAASTDSDYQVQLTVSDSFNTVSGGISLLPAAFALLDFDRTNKAVGIGQRAGTAGTLSVGLPIKMGTNRVTDMGAPTDAADAATKGYVDSKLKFGGVSMANSVVMEYSLGTSFTDEQSADIRSGKFEKVHVGGYWTINGRKYWAAHADYRLHCGDTELTTHHMLVIPDKSFYKGVMNDSNVTTGAYCGSKMKTSGLADALATVKADFGTDHILTHRVLLAIAVSNGLSYGWAWYDSQIDLMNEKMVYGSHAWGGGSKNGYDTGSDKSQLALFQARPDLITIRENWWLRDVRSATLFCGVNSEGYASGWDASDSLGVRPAFLIY